MRKSLERVVARVSKLPGKEQDAIVALVRDHLASMKHANAKARKLKMPDFAARARAIFGGRKIDTAALLDHNKGRY